MYMLCLQITQWENGQETRTGNSLLGAALLGEQLGSVYTI